MSAMTLRPRAERGYTDFGWLQTYQSFSFGRYYDPAHRQYSALRVLNEDRVAGGAGFTMHEHHNAEILTFVLSGTLRHEDDLGHREEMGPGDCQRISAGAGVKHSEVNVSILEPVHLIQVWLLPDVADVAPSYDKQRFEPAPGTTTRLVASGDGRDGSMLIRQDASVYVVRPSADEATTLALDPARRVYVHVAVGMATVNGQGLVSGDALMLEGATALAIQADPVADVLVFDLP
jgi:redox-sensitive bicupin YhaK (pirin superfamily)